MLCGKSEVVRTPGRGIKVVFTAKGAKPGEQYHDSAGGQRYEAAKVSESEETVIVELRTEQMLE
jgi:hypothetical protein